MSTKVSIFFGLFVILAGCGENSNYNSSTGGGGGSTTGLAQGVYSGTSSTGVTFDTIVLPNDKFYAIYGTVSGNVLLISDMITGQGVSGTNSYTATVTDFSFSGTATAGSLSATYVAGSSVNGTITENGTTTTFNGAALQTSNFNYSAPASLSSVSGTWSGLLLNGAPATITISSTGTVSGASQGCSFTGTVAADSSNKNFFDVSLTFGASPCLLPNQTETGIGVEYLLSNGITHQLLAAVTLGTTSGNGFAATR